MSTTLRLEQPSYLTASSGAPETFSTLDEETFGGLAGIEGCSRLDSPDVLRELFAAATVGTTLRPAQVRVGDVGFAAAVAAQDEGLRVGPLPDRRELPAERALVSLQVFDSSYCFAAEQLGKDGDGVRLAWPEHVILRNRRGHARRKLARPLPAALVLGGGTASCEVRDISEAGAGLAAPMIGQADVPAVHALRLDLPSGALLAQASPRWSHQAGARLYLGLAFVDFAAGNQLDLVEQRHTARLILDPQPPCRLVRADGEIVDGRVVDIGELGARVDFTGTFASAETPSWSLTLQLGGSELTVEAEQRWFRSEGDGQAVGLHFIPPVWA